MKAIAVAPGVPNTVHLTELPTPSVSEIPNGRGVLVRVLRVGVDGTDKEINAAEYGQAPPGYDFYLEFVLGNKVNSGQSTPIENISSWAFKTWRRPKLNIPVGYLAY